MARGKLNRLTAALLLWTCSATVVINEVANKGSTGVCDGEDWIELHNTGAEAVDLGRGYMLHDDKGIGSEDAFLFPSDQFEKTLLAADSYLMLCTNQKLPPVTDEVDGIHPTYILEEGQDGVADPMSPQFGLSSEDGVFLVKLPDGFNDTISIGRQGLEPLLATYNVLDHVTLPGTDGGFDITYARDPKTGIFKFTSTPTPGEENTMTKLLTHDEILSAHKEALREKEVLGRKFFNMDEHGYPVENPMDTVLELSITMEAADYEYMMENQTFEEYRPFQSAKLYTLDGNEVASLDSPGRVRPKGQSGLFVATCLGVKTIPFQLDFDNVNASQTLFGVKRVFLRHHGEDYSFSREWAYYRMLARFGLPFLRARKVTFKVNGITHGFYTLIETPEDEYVFARSFPDYNPDSFALYKIKSLAKGCGDYTQEMIEQAKSRLDDTSTPPYAFERGEHKNKTIVKNYWNFDFCRRQFVDKYFESIQPDIVLAYLRHDEDCPTMLMEEGLIERDLGTKDWDKKLEYFIADHLGPNKCDLGCANSDLKQEVDVENWLKMFAFYATTLSLDSPISFNNNYYLAQSESEATGGQGGWKIVAYDLNAREAVDCNNEVCNERLIHWSIARPSCESLESNQLVGPLLTDPELHGRYLEYVREFVDTIYGNETMWEEIRSHIVEIGNSSSADFWSAFSAFYHSEINPQAETWNSGQFPFLAFIKARTADVREQLAAIDEGKLARAPHIGSKGDNEAWETCADWRAEEYNTSSCEKGCKYRGCEIPGWTVESFCDEKGKCLHGDYDELCYGIPDGGRYQGMQDGEDGMEVFCRLAKGIPLKTSYCPDIREVSESHISVESSARYLSSGWLATFIFVMTTAMEMT